MNFARQGASRNLAPIFSCIYVSVYTLLNNVRYKNNILGTKQCVFVNEWLFCQKYMFMLSCIIPIHFSIDLGFGVLAPPCILLRELHSQNPRTVGPGLRQDPPRRGSRRIEAERRLRRHREAARSKAALGQPHSRLLRSRESCSSNVSMHLNTDAAYGVYR